MTQHQSETPSRKRVDWTEQELAMVIGTAGELINQQPFRNLASLLKEAQSRLPEEKQRSDKGIVQFVNRYKGPVSLAINEASVAYVTNMGTEVPVTPSQVVGTSISVAATETGEAQSAVSVGTNEVSGTPVTAVEASAEVSKTKLFWKEKELKAVCKKVAELNPGLQNVDTQSSQDISTLMIDAQVHALPGSRRRHGQKMYGYVFKHKVTIVELINTYLYRAAKRASEVVPPESSPEGSTDVAVLAVEGSDLDTSVAGLTTSLDRLVNAVALTFRNNLMNKVDEIISGLPLIMESKLEAAMVGSLETVMNKVETKVVSAINNREVVREKVLIVGPQPDQQNAITREMGQLFDIRYISSEEGAKQIKAQLNFAKHIIAMTGKMGHHQFEAIKGRPNLHLVNGASSSVIAKLTEIYAAS